MKPALLSTVFTAFIALLPAVGLAASSEIPHEILVQWKAQPNQLSSLHVQNVRTAIQVLKNDPRIAHVEPNYKRATFEISGVTPVTPNDPYFPTAYHLEQDSDADIDAATAWATTTGSKDVIVAVIDTGVDLTHPDLADNIWMNEDEIPDNNIDDDENGFIDDVSGWDFMGDDADPSPTPSSNTWDSTTVGHGTHVAGIVGAVGNNDEGVSGVNWAVSLMPVRALDERGETSVKQIVAAIQYAVANGADIINLSFGGYRYSRIEAQAVADATAAGVLVVAAAGNSSVDIGAQPMYPACYPNVMAVAATNAQDELAGFSNYGNCVDIAAPGDNILSTVFRGSPELGFTDAYEFMAGTSMSSPVIAGAGALLLARDHELTVPQLIAALTSTAEPIDVTTVGAGRVNIAKAMNSLSKTSDRPNAVTIQGFTSKQITTILDTAARTHSSRPYFTWAAPTNVEVSGYYVYFGTLADANPITAGNFQTGHTFKPSRPVVANEEFYYLRIVALGKTGLRSPVSEYTYIPDTFVAAPKWNTAKWTAGKLELLWKEPKNEHITSYAIYRSTHKNGPFVQLAYRITSLNYFDTTAVSGKRYYYRIRAMDDFENVSKPSQTLIVKL